MLNLGNPDLAFKTSFLPNDGVGLARMEFIVSEYIKAHPLALVHPERVSDPQARASDRPADPRLPRRRERSSCERLSEGIGTIAAAFWPKPVVVRMSDFKTNEYASLLGGADFEPNEENPMLGFRGASRYAHPAYEEGFALECRAMKRVREQMGLTNVMLMLPFVRRVEEAERVLARMAELGLRARRERSRGLRDVRDPQQRDPDRPVRADASTASRSGRTTSRSSRSASIATREIVAFDYDERDEGVKQMIRLAVEGCARNGDPLGTVRSGPERLPGHGGVPGRARDRLDQPQPRHGDQDHAADPRARAAAQRRQACRLASRSRTSVW